eukprot:CAMPEP_0119104166 /NCGR_PEP_ID=MMETSP1180-20130426/2445_1 /TAXON_ID=3052 ORGANISM="Chlamydomonas cf sp, Strain CCMP681" /NCGR_SAMPLE_ID=MMETSP1180 /ASSEMBLY_ACC=CAM_ASM_000741 /LENGTH=308 /DNA_ID=CAMNT_0007088847 /DNA_START=132 /DNA_END=1058 /DNA_ORIENTATION=-
MMTPHRLSPNSQVAATAKGSLDQQGHPEIRLICTDVDGTLLNSQQKLTPPVEAAIKAAAAAGVPLVVATGKARGPWVQDVFPRLDMDMPGVFMQGLLVCDAQGGILKQQDMEHQVVLDCLALAELHGGIVCCAYCGDRILAVELDEHTERLLFYREPVAEAVGKLSAMVGKVPMQKLLFMAPQPTLDQLRPLAEELLEGRASLTSAINGVLEVLPFGASKGAGVAWLLERLGVDPQHVMALGDGENDVEMLQLVGLGVAMGNAAPKACLAADVRVGTNDEDGVAEAIERYVLAPRGLSSLPSVTTVAV